MDGTIWKVRSKDYPTTHVKLRSQPSFCKLLCVDIFKSTARISHIAAHPESALSKIKTLSMKDTRCILVINLQIAGNISIVSYLAIPRLQEPQEPQDAQDAVVAALCERFLTGTKEWRDARMKMLPHIEEGGFLIRKAVGTTPCIIGTKGESAYFSVGDEEGSDV